MNYPQAEQILRLDGAGEVEGAAVLDTALAIALALQIPFRLDAIGAHGARPGLSADQISLIHAAADISGAYIDGDTPGSASLAFHPGRVAGGDWCFDLSPQGHCGRLLQLLLPALLQADRPTTLVLDGITHAEGAPAPAMFSHTLAPLIHRMGPQLRVWLERPGFGGPVPGRLRVEVTPVARLRPLALSRRGKVLGLAAESLLANLPAATADEQLARVAAALPVHAAGLRRHEFEAGDTGNAVSVSVYSEALTEVFTATDATGARTRDTAQAAIRAAQAYLDDDIAVRRELAQALLVPMALAGGGRLLTEWPDARGRAAMQTLTAFTGRTCRAQQQEGGEACLLVCA